MVELGVEGSVRWLGVEGEGVDLVVGPAHGTFRHGGISWRLPDESDVNPTAPVGHTEVGELAIIVKEIERVRDWSLPDGGGAELASESHNLLSLILHDVAEGGSLVEEGLRGSLSDSLQLPTIPIGAVCLKEGKGRTR